MLEKADIRRRVQLWAGALRGHLQPVEIKEDEEKLKAAFGAESEE